MSKVYAYDPDLLEGMSMKLEWITPELAKEWLDKHNVENYRPMKPRKVRQYARAMAEGRWQLTTETIKFEAGTGHLVDGQNRLQAIVDSGVTLLMAISRGVSPKAVDSMDTGAARTAADVLRHHGGSDVSTVAAAVRIGLLATSGDRISWRDNVTHEEIAEWVDEHPEIYGMGKVLGPNHKKIPLRPAVRLWLAWAFSRKDVMAAAEFFDRFATGENLTKGNPILALRNRLTGLYGQMKKVTVEDQLNITIRAWNAWVQGRTLERVVDSTRYSKPGQIVEILGPSSPWPVTMDLTNRDDETGVNDWLEEHGEETTSDNGALCTCTNYPKVIDAECPKHREEVARA